ncbi:Lysosomal & prostatic acid phosphatases [Ceraceosorus bombacis]|uniref:Lysosomal & prostatic acid phosphatases n=1 Tax=Ceraceosorus bombacis TaxID=401625 RepID=A0A0P1BJF5_9BASI|nr:Lysosomal & prostatic acid phosphatases [Ceraceosorus bombacis]
MATVSGVLVFARHGDRQGFYQSPTTYSATKTNLTVAGYVQEYNLGTDLRNAYLNTSSPSLIQGINTTVSQNAQLSAAADAGGESGPILESAAALLQGLYPPYSETITLANGNVVSWDNRAQLIPIETVEADQSPDFEGWTDCSSFEDRLADFYASDDFKKQAAIANPFFASLKGVLGPNRPAKLENAWNIFDFLNVESIHNTTLAPQIGAQNLSLAKYWADYHEAGSFTDTDKSNVGNVAGQAFLAPVLDSLHRLDNATDPLKFSLLQISYKPFLSLFKMFDLGAPLSTSVVDYASAAVFEVYSDHSIRMLFRNGTSGPFEPYALLGSNSMTMPLSDFNKAMQPYNLDTLSKWCNQCSETEAKGCSTLAALNGTGGAGYASVTSTEGRHAVSPVVAGVIGAFVALAVAAALLALWLLAGGLVKKHRGANAAPIQRRDAKGQHELQDRASNASTRQEGSHTDLVKQASA